LETSIAEKFVANPSNMTKPKQKKDLKKDGEVRNQPRITSFFVKVDPNATPAPNSNSDNVRPLRQSKLLYFAPKSSTTSTTKKRKSKSQQKETELRNEGS